MVAKKSLENGLCPIVVQPGHLQTSTEYLQIRLDLTIPTVHKIPTSVSRLVGKYSAWGIKYGGKDRMAGWKRSDATYFGRIYHHQADERIKSVKTKLIPSFNKPP